MSSKSNIEWTDASWNPVVGCDRVSPGCAHCYAKTLHDQRHSANLRQATVFSGLFEEGDRHIRADEGWSSWEDRVGEPPEGWAARARALAITMPMPPQYDQPFETVQLLPDRLDAPIHWRKPRRVFVNSMSDLFHDSVPDSFIDRVFAVMAICGGDRVRCRGSNCKHDDDSRGCWRHGDGCYEPIHTFQILTKRPERMKSYIDARTHWRQGVIDALNDPEWGRSYDRIEEIVEPLGWPLPNVWLGVSVENQRWADERIPILLDTPAAVRFVSCEPLLGPVDLTRWLCGYVAKDAGDDGSRNIALDDEVREERVQEGAHIHCPPDCPSTDGLPSPAQGAVMIPSNVTAHGVAQPVDDLDGRAVNRHPRGIGQADSTAKPEIALPVEQSRDVAERGGIAGHVNRQSAESGAASAQGDAALAETAADGRGIGAVLDGDRSDREAPPVGFADLIDGKLHSAHHPYCISWVIVGAESGRKHRPLDLAWVESLRDQCAATGTAYFGKQAGGARPGTPLPGRLGDREFP